MLFSIPTNVEVSGSIECCKQWRRGKAQNVIAYSLLRRIILDSRNVSYLCVSLNVADILRRLM